MPARLPSIVLCALLAACAAPRVAEGPTSSSRAAIASVRGCDMAYTLYPAATPSSGPVAIIAHGFLRDGSFMAGWAEAIAAAGIPAVTVDLCATGGAGRHADNGADLVALRRSLRFREAIYVGVSAGGLAALVAASNDPDATRGLLLLDPVNAGGQARSAAGRMHAPAAALVAKPQMCNAWGNFEPALRTLGDATTVRIANASHCDFEWPGDRFCRAACVATNDRAEREQAQARIRRIGVDFVVAAARGDAAELARWRGAIGPD